MPVVALFHTNNTWTKHRILWSGYYIADEGVSLFGDAFSQSIAGQHNSALPGYPSYGNSVTVTRLDMIAGKLAVAGRASDGVPYTLVGPTTEIDGGKLTNYLDEFCTALGSLYIETSPPSGSPDYFTIGKFHWHPSYPPSGTGWFTVSGFGNAMNDVIGLDYPDNARVLVSTSDLANLSSGTGSPGIMVINVASGAAQELRYQTYFPSNVAKDLGITDLEAQRILG